MKRLLIKLFHKIVTFINFNVGNKVKPYHLLYNQLQKHRINDMTTTLNKQIDLYLLNSNKKQNFIFVEIGSYLGESLELWGDLLEKRLKDNFQIISIDPYKNYVSETDKNWQPNKSRASTKMSKVIEKVYMYFVHNISLKKWKDKHTHMRMSSKNALKVFENRGLKIDFCYIDGSHYYDNFKFDIENYNKILKSIDEYKGIICGDDYEFSYEELLKKFEKEELNKILVDNKTTDCLIYKDFIFHPGITLAMSETKLKIKKFESGFFTGIK